MYISKSSLGTYLQCPRKFKYTYIDKIRTETSQQAQRGIDVHRFINEFYDHLVFVDDTFALDPNFKDAFFEECLPEAKPLIENFINFEFSRWEICKQLCPKSPKKLFIPLLREGKFVSDELQLVTILDRLDLRTDGNYTLIEIKTEKFQNRSWKSTEFRREMMFEKIAAESSPEFRKQFPNEIVEFVVYFPHSNDIFTEPFNQRTAKALEKYLRKMRQDIENKNYPCNVQYACRFCPHNLICDMEMCKK